MENNNPKIALVGTYNETMKKAFYDNVPSRFTVAEFPLEKEYDKLYEFDPDYILNRTTTLSAADIEGCKNLKLITKYAVGFDNIDIAAAAKRKIPVTNCNGFNSDSVAELTVMLMLAMLRNLLPQNEALKKDEWTMDKYVSLSYTLKSKTVGIIGMGNIGSRVCRLVSAFGAKVNYYDINRLSSEAESELGAVYMPFYDVLANSDIVTLHTPGGASTYHMISANEIAAMKDNSWLVNCSRGPVVDEAAVVTALKSGKLAGCAADVFEVEPPFGSDFVKLSNVVSTPHIGGSTNGLAAGMIKFCLQCIDDFDNGLGLPEKNIVNRNLM